MLEEVRGGQRRSEVTGGQGSEVTGGVGSDLLNEPWLHSLLKVYECLLRFHRVSPCPLLPYASALSHEILGVIRTLSCPSGDIRELYDLLTSAHMQAVLSSHDSVAQSDYEPVLPRLPDQEEDATLPVCLLKDNRPLRGEESGRGRGWRRWNSLRRIALERLLPGRRASVGEVTFRSEKGGVRLLSWPRAPPTPQASPSLPRYESTGSCRLCHQSAVLRGKGLNQSAPSVCNPAPQAVICNNNSDYASPPHPVLAYSSPAAYQRTTGGRCRTVPTPGRTPPPASHTAPSSPAARRSVPQASGSGQCGRQKATQVQSGRADLGANSGSLNRNQKPADQIRDERPNLRLQPHRHEASLELSRRVKQTVGGDMEQGEQDGLEELLVEAVDKLQGHIVATGGRRPAPPPPPRTSSISPKATPTTPKLRLRLSSSSSSSSASSCPSSRSSSSSSSGCHGDSLAPPPLPRLNGGRKREVVAASGATQRPGGVGAAAGNGRIRLNNGALLPPSGAEDQAERQTTRCLSAKKKMKKKKK